MNCPKCNHKFDDSVVLSESAKIIGSNSTKKSACAARKNGMLGGRPRMKNKQDASRRPSGDDHDVRLPCGH